ncbi:UNVERIFIED_CONTAM: hypothetical protein FKN15_029246 [Acipenser sinensis]
MAAAADPREMTAAVDPREANSVGEPLAMKVAAGAPLLPRTLYPVRSNRQPQAMRRSRQPQAMWSSRQPQAMQSSRQPREVIAGGEPGPAVVLGLGLFSAAATRRFSPLHCSAAYARAAVDHQPSVLFPPVMKGEAAPAPLPWVVVVEAEAAPAPFPQVVVVEAEATPAALLLAKASGAPPLLAAKAAGAPPLLAAKAAGVSTSSWLAAPSSGAPTTHYPAVKVRLGELVS